MKHCCATTLCCYTTGNRSSSSNSGNNYSNSAWGSATVEDDANGKLHHVEEEVEVSSTDNTSVEVVRTDAAAIALQRRAFQDQVRLSNLTNFQSHNSYQMIALSMLL
jgi:hypothetical protein